MIDDIREARGDAQEPAPEDKSCPKCGEEMTEPNEGICEECFFSYEFRERVAIKEDSGIEREEAIKQAIQEIKDDE